MKRKLPTLEPEERQKRPRRNQPPSSPSSPPSLSSPSFSSPPSSPPSPTYPYMECESDEKASINLEWIAWVRHRYRPREQGMRAWILDGPGTQTTECMVNGGVDPRDIVVIERDRKTFEAQVERFSALGVLDAIKHREDCFFQQLEACLADANGDIPRLLYVDLTGNLTDKDLQVLVRWRLWWDAGGCGAVGFLLIGWGGVESIVSAVEHRTQKLHFGDTPSVDRLIVTIRWKN